MTPIGCDTETTGNSFVHGAEAFLVCFASNIQFPLSTPLHSGRAYKGGPRIRKEDDDGWFYITLQYNLNPYTRRVLRDETFFINQKILLSTLRTPDHFFVFHNVKFDVKALASVDAFPDFAAMKHFMRWRTADTVHLSHLTQSTREHGLKKLAAIVSSIPADDEADLKKVVEELTPRAFSRHYNPYPSAMPYKMKTPNGGWWKVNMWLPQTLGRLENKPPEHPWNNVCATYCRRDAKRTLCVEYDLEGLAPVDVSKPRRLQHDATVALLAIESSGMCMNLDSMELEEERLTKQLAVLLKHIQAVTSPYFNPASSVQMKEYCFGFFGFPITERSKKKPYNPSTGKIWLKQMIDMLENHPWEYSNDKKKVARAKRFLYAVYMFKRVKTGLAALVSYKQKAVRWVPYQKTRETVSWTGERLEGESGSLNQERSLSSFIPCQTLRRGVAESSLVYSSASSSSSSVTPDRVESHTECLMTPSFSYLPSSSALLPLWLSGEAGRLTDQLSKERSWQLPQRGPRKTLGSGRLPKNLVVSEGTSRDGSPRKLEAPQVDSQETESSSGQILPVRSTPGERSSTGRLATGERSSQPGSKQNPHSPEMNLAEVSRQMLNGLKLSARHSASLQTKSVTSSLSTAAPTSLRLRSSLHSKVLISSTMWTGMKSGKVAASRRSMSQQLPGQSGQEQQKSGTNFEGCTTREKLPDQVEHSSGRSEKSDQPLRKKSLLRKLSSTLALHKPLPQLESMSNNSRRCWLYPSLNPTGTGTTRLASKDPNGQNIGTGKDDLPDSSPLKKLVKKLHLSMRRHFGPAEGTVWLSCDYSQLQLVIFALLSREEAMCAAVARGDDMHNATAEQIYGKPGPNGFDKGQRTLAKNINFGFVFGAKDKKLETLGIKGIRKILNDKFPDAVAFIRYNEERAQESGFIITPGGYPLFTPDGRAYAATNYIVQGAEGELVKQALVYCDDFLASGESGVVGLDGHSHFPSGRISHDETTSLPPSGQDSQSLPPYALGRIIMQVHDEILFELPINSYLVSTIRTLVQLMQDAGNDFGFPLQVGAELITNNWAEGTKCDPQLLEHLHQTLQREDFANQALTQKMLAGILATTGSSVQTQTLITSSSKS